MPIRSLSLNDVSSLPSSRDVERPSLARSQSESDVSGITSLNEDLLRLVRHADEPTDLHWGQLTPMLEDFGRRLDDFNAEVRGSWSDHGHGGVNADAADTIERALDGRPSASSASPHPSVRGLDIALSRHLDDQATAVGHALSPHERAVAVFQFLGGGLRAIAENNFQSPGARWAANFANAGVRTGLIVGVTTTARQLIGFGIEKSFALGETSVPARAAIGASAMMIGMGLNIAGAIRDEANHTATNQSRVARGAMLALSVGTLAASATVGTSGAETVLSGLMRSFGPQMATYTLARDLAQAFFPLRNNAPINARGTAAEALLYGGVQVAVGEAMDHWSPHSGAGYAMGLAGAARAQGSTTPVSDEVTQSIFNWATSQAAPGIHASPESRVQEALRAMSPDIGHDVRRGVLNASAEIYDDIAGPFLARTFHVSNLVQTTRREALAHHEDPAAAVAALPAAETEGLRISVGARIPNRTQLAQQFLTTDSQRTSAFQVIMHGALTAATLLGRTSLSEADQAHATNAVVGALCATIYAPFLYAHAQRTPPAAAQAAATPPQAHPADPEMELTRRGPAAVQTDSDTSDADEGTSLAHRRV